MGKGLTTNETLQNLIEKIVEIRAISAETSKSNRDLETQFGHLTGWFKDATEKIDDINTRLEDMQNIGFQDIKTRIVQSEKSKASISEFNAKAENALKHIIKYHQANEVQMETLNKKLELLGQTQAESFNPSQFIDIFYENMTQTKMLANRIEIIEDKMNNIQNCIEKLLSYVEQ